MENNLLIHKHLIIRAEVSNPPNDVTVLTQWLKDFIISINMRIMMGPYVAYCNEPGNRGITGIAVIETSHIAMHVWDEPSPALMQLDVYSCADFDPYKIAEKIKQDFNVVKIDYKFLNRETGLKPIRLKKGAINESIR
jgi:S-adenosylmethionine/arginine decarboxylase-like enzyme|tara:strand:+ start:879 stop:1292 length:414 start_codon:yes stop_codon:yes gene_type:complete